MVGITLCALLRFLRLMGTKILVYPSLLLSWMFEHDCLYTCWFGGVLYAFFYVLYFHLFSATEFDMKRCSRNLSI